MCIFSYLYCISTLVKFVSFFLWWIFFENLGFVWFTLFARDEESGKPRIECLFCFISCGLL